MEKVKFCCYVFGFQYLNVSGPILCFIWSMRGLKLKVGAQENRGLKLKLGSGRNRGDMGARGGGGVDVQPWGAQSNFIPTLLDFFFFQGPRPPQGTMWLRPRSWMSLRLQIMKKIVTFVERKFLKNIILSLFSVNVFLVKKRLLFSI